MSQTSYRGPAFTLNMQASKAVTISTEHNITLRLRADTGNLLNKPIWSASAEISTAPALARSPRRRVPHGSNRSAFGVLGISLIYKTTMRTNRWKPFCRLAATIVVAAISPSLPRRRSACPRWASTPWGKITSSPTTPSFWSKLGNKVAKETDRMKLVEYGKTAEGRPMIMAIITSPANHKKLARSKEFSQRLARAEGTDATSRSTNLRPREVGLYGSMRACTLPNRSTRRRCFRRPTICSAGAIRRRCGCSTTTFCC